MEKEKDIAPKEKGLLLDAWVFSYRLINQENLEQSLQELGNLGRQLRSLKNETYQKDINQKIGDTQEGHEKVLKDQSEVLKERQKVLKNCLNIIQDIPHFRNLYINSSLDKNDRIFYYGLSKEVLQKLNETRQGDLNVLQKRDDVLQKRLEVLQEHWAIRQQLHDTQDMLTHGNLPDEERGYWEKLREVMLKHSEIMQQLHDTLDELAHENLSPQRRARLEMSREILQKHSEILQKCSQREFLKNWTSISQRDCKLAESRQKIRDYDYSQIAPDLQERVKKTINSIIRLHELHLYYIKGYKHKVDSVSESDIIQMQKVWEDKYGYKWKYVEVLSKYPKVLQDLRERESTHHSQAEDASCMVLEMRKGNLDWLSDIIGNQHQYKLYKNVLDMRVKFEEDLENFSSHQTDSNLSPEEREKLLQNLQERSDVLKECQEVRKLQLDTEQKLWDTEYWLIAHDLSKIQGIAPYFSPEQYADLQQTQKRLQMESTTRQEQYEILQKQCEVMQEQREVMQELHDTKHKRSPIPKNLK